MKEIERKYGLVGRGARRGDGGRGDARRWISGEGAGRQWDGGGGHGGGSAERGRDDGWAKHDWGRGEGMADRGRGKGRWRKRGRRDFFLEYARIFLIYPGSFYKTVGRLYPVR